MDELPNTFIIGAAKAGTTTLYDLLKQHPQVYLSFDKEPMFFSRDDYFERGVDWYCERFFKNSENYPIRAEATPHYLYWADKVAPRMKKVFQGKPLNLVIILRNPIQRAYSWYWNMVNEGKEDLSFMEALAAEEDRLNAKRNELSRYGSMQYGYVRGGCYSTQIKRFLEDFPTEAIKILLLDDLVKDQEKTLQGLFSFLGIDEKIKIASRVSNQSTKPKSQTVHRMIRTRSRLKEILKPFFPPHLLFLVKTNLLQRNLEPFKYPKMEDQPYEYLKQKLASEISELSTLLNRDLSSWVEK